MRASSLVNWPWADRSALSILLSEFRRRISGLKGPLDLELHDRFYRPEALTETQREHGPPSVASMMAGMVAKLTGLCATVKERGAWSDHCSPGYWPR